eukprot:2805980-Alexandrium_andersonii.AAC.1
MTGEGKVPWTPGRYGRRSRRVRSYLARRTMRHLARELRRWMPNTGARALACTCKRLGTGPMQSN